MSAAEKHKHFLPEHLFWHCLVLKFLSFLVYKKALLFPELTEFFNQNSSSFEVLVLKRTNRQLFLIFSSSNNKTKKMKTMQLKVRWFTAASLPVNEFSE